MTNLCTSQTEIYHHDHAHEFVYQPDRNLSQTKNGVLLTFHYICFMDENKEPEEIIIDLPFDNIDLPLDIIDIPFDKVDIPFDVINLPFDIIDLPFE